LLYQGARSAKVSAEQHSPGFGRPLEEDAAKHDRPHEINFRASRLTISEKRQHTIGSHVNPRGARPRARLPSV